MTEETLTLLEKTVYPKWAEHGERPGRRPADPAVLAMIVQTARRFANQADLEDANDDLEHDEVAYTSIDQLSGENVFHEATFRMTVAAENWEYIHYVVGRGGAPRFHVIEIHESNSYGAVFAPGDTETILLIIDDGTFAYERPEFRAYERALQDIVYA